MWWLGEATPYKYNIFAALTVISTFIKCTNPKAKLVFWNIVLLSWMCEQNDAHPLNQLIYYETIKFIVQTTQSYLFIVFSTFFSFQKLLFYFILLHSIVFIHFNSCLIFYRRHWVQFYFFVFQIIWLL